MNRLHVAICAATVAACDSPSYPANGIYGYTWRSSASGIDGANGDTLRCGAFGLANRVDGGFGRQWDGVMPFYFSRSRRAATLATSRDTNLGPQPFHLERLGDSTVRITLGGVMGDTVLGAEDTRSFELYGDWTCKATFPLVSMHDGQVVRGTWRLVPMRYID
jgi:hypothetical protein